MSEKLINQTQTYHVSSRAKAYQHSELRDEVGWIDAMRKTAGRSLADAILKEASELRVIEPTKEEVECDPFAAVEYRWTVRVVMPGDLFNYFGKQLEEARDEAKAETIGKVREIVAYALQRAENWRGIELLIDHGLKGLETSSSQPTT